MSAAGFVNTRFLILRKMLYQESSLIIDGISPERGRLRFIVRGARRLGRKQFPGVDIFRLMQICYRESRQDLLQWREADLDEDFAAVAGSPAAYRTAVWLSDFALGNLTAQLELPLFFDAVIHAFRNLKNHALTHEQVLTLTGLTYLHESGMLDVPDAELAEKGRCRLLLEAARGTVPPPRLTEECWRDLSGWTLLLLHHAEAFIPKGG